MKKKILLIDDSATARALFKICLINNEDYEIVEASRWQDALEKAKLHRPFLIILDYNMPEKSGSELAKLMQDDGIEAHYVLLSANTQNSVINEVRELGFFDIIEKPVTAAAVNSLFEKLQ